MDVFWNIVEVVSTAFENYVVIETLEKMFGHKYSGWKKYISFYFTLFLSTGYVIFINLHHYFEGWLALITILIFVIYSAVFIQNKTYLKLLTPVILFSLILGINMSVTYIMSAIFYMPDTFIYSSSDGARILALITTKFIFFIMSRIIINLYKKDSFELNRKESLVIIAMFALSLIISICLINFQKNKDDVEIVIFIAVSCILVNNIFIFYMIKKILKDNKNQLKISILELQISEQKNMIEEAGMISYDIKKAEHDLKHHLLSILGMIEVDNAKSAEEYLKDLLHDYETSIFKYVSIENNAINSILNLKIGRCHANKIDIKVEIASNFLGFSDIDICVLLANLLDNAIESSNNVKTPRIVISITTNKNYLCVEIRNRIESSVLENNKDFNTTKSNKSKHGFGIYSISQIVEKYDGIKKYYEQNGFFIADIWLKRNQYLLEKHIDSGISCQTRQK